MNFLKNYKISVVEAAAAAAQTALTTDILDMEGFDGVIFIALTGDVTDTSVLGLNVEHGDASGGGDMADTTASAAYTAGASDADSKVLAVDVYKPLKRYVRGVLTRTTANAVIGGIIAIQYQGRKCPVAQDATVIDSVLAISPASA